MDLRDYLLDLADVLLVAWLFYRLLLVFRQTRAIRVVAGLAVLALVYWVAHLLRFEGLLGLVDTLRGNSLEIGMVILAVIFADEIKDAFGGFFWRLGEGQQKTADEEVIAHVSRAAASMAARQCGALIAIARENPLDRWEIEDSVAVDAAVGAELLETIFVGKTPLHDGGVIIRRGRIVAAKCQLPRSANPAVTKARVGMRHRAAFGLSEQSDAVVVVVSEERGTVSVAHRGRLHSPIEPDQLASFLRKLMGVGEQALPLYHPRRLVRHGWLKLAAFGLAGALWADQTTTFAVTDEVEVREAGGSAARVFPLRPGERVVVSAGAELRPVLREGEGLWFEQTLPAVEYRLTGKNLARLALLPRVADAWWSGEPRRARQLLGPIAVELPAGRGAGGAPAPLALPLARKADAFTLESATVEVVIDELAPLNGAAIEVAYTGEPAAGYTARTPSPVKPVLPAGAGNLVVPRAQKDRIEATLKGCPTRPPLAIDGRTAVYAESIELLVPDEARRWNPGYSFRGRVTIEILSDTARLALQAEEAQRAQLEAERAQESQRALEARERFADLDRRLKDGTWEQGYRLEQYVTLRERIVPDLERRLEKARLELEATSRAVERLRADAAASPADPELAAVKLNAAIREQQARREVLEAVSVRLDLRRREQTAIGERLDPLLEEVRRIEQRAEEALRAEPPPPVLDDERGLAALIDSVGPAGDATSEGARAIGREASARVPFALFERALTGFERRLESGREATQLAREMKELEDQLKQPQAPGATSAVRLDIAVKERGVRLAAARRRAAREAALWADLSARLVQADQVMGKESGVLERIVRGWSVDEARALEVGALYDLVREAFTELPQLVAAEQFLREQRARARARLAEPLPADNPLFAEVHQEVYRDLERDLGQAHALWVGEEGRAAGALAQVRERLRVLAAVIARAASEGTEANGLAAFDAEAAELAADRAALAAVGRQRADLASGARPPRLGDLDDARAARAKVMEELTAATASRDAAAAEIAELDARLSAATVAGQPLDAAARGLAARSAAAKARLAYRHERVRGLGQRRAEAEGLVADLERVLQPVLELQRVRESELEVLRATPSTEKANADQYLTSRRADTELRRDVAAACRALPALALEPAVLAERLVRALRPLPEDDRGIDHLVAALNRADIAEDRLRALNAPLEGSAGAATGVPEAARAALEELLANLRTREIEVRRKRQDELRATIDGLRGLLFDGADLSAAIAHLEGPGVLPAALARALEAAGLEAIEGEVARALAARRQQRDEAQRESTARADASERLAFARRAQVLGERVARLERLADEVARVRAATSRALREAPGLERPDGGG